MISWRGANALGLSLPIPVALRKKVTWKPSGLPSAPFSQPVTYHHSVLKAGWAPLSCGKASVRPGSTGANAGAAARQAGENQASDSANSVNMIRIYQSSLTERIGSPDNAWRPDTSAVTTEAASKVPATLASSPHGRCMRMLQWKDCGLTT